MRLTLEGKKFLLLALLIAVAAVNTANNLMFLVFSMMLSILFIAFITLGINMKALSLRASIGQPAYAGQRAFLDLTVSNSKSHINSYSLRVHMPEGIYGEGHVAFVPAGSETTGKAQVLFERRGLYMLDDFRLESGFPFIFVSKVKKVRSSGEILVYPEIIDIESIFPAVIQRGREIHIMRPGRGEELLGIREMRPGDDMRMVSWRTSAKAEKIMVKEFAEEAPRTVTVVLDDHGPFNEDLFERAVSVAASVISTLIEEEYYVKLVTCDKVLPLGTGTGHLHRMMELLALAKEGDNGKCVVEDELIGSSVLVLKSFESSLKDHSPVFDSVLYASDI
jgi:uncharacterized protein (DUF58 family)